jgi:WXG100 family type VII secretion target
MTTYQVDSDAVLNATGMARASASRLQAEAAALHSHLLSLQGSWTGQAAAAFQTVVGDWKMTQQRIDESLASINSALALAGQQYAEIEMANTRLFAR